MADFETSDQRKHESDVAPSSSSLSLWLPLSFVASAAAIGGPIFLLRRYRAAQALRRHAVISPRRAPSSASALSALQAPSLGRTTLRPVPPDPSIPVPEGQDVKFNGALYAFKALAIATLFVTAGATASVWSITSALGVRDTKDFAEYMRYVIRSRMSYLVFRIHREPDMPLTIEQDPDPGWNWPDAEKRLKAAYMRDGAAGWLKAALEEVEQEAKVERIKRGFASET